MTIESSPLKHVLGMIVHHPLRQRLHLRWLLLPVYGVGDSSAYGSIGVSTNVHVAC